jgi:CBS domain-containing protein
MHLVDQLLRQKPGPVRTIAPEATVLEAATLMNEHRIGALVVVQGQDPVGIISERDILTRVVAAEREPSKIRVSEVMTSHLITCTPRSPLDEVRRIMRERRIRHIPVVDGGRLLGIISIGDLNQAETRALTATLTYLEEYITH